MTKDEWYKQLFEHLEASRFRSSFHLKQKNIDSGKVDVLIKRALDAVINWNDDFEYQDAEIETAVITEDSYEDDESDFDIYCSECGEKIGYEWESFYKAYKGNPICDDCMTICKRIVK